VRDNIMPLPYKEPSQVLMALLNQITEEARRLGSVSDMKIGDMSGTAPVGTTLAILERQLKTMSAVQARVHFSMKEEFKLLKNIIRDNTPSSYDYDPIGGDRKLKQSDYDLVNVIPVSDPNSATMAQRIMQYQAVIQLSQTAPQIYDLPQLHRQMIEVLGIKNADKLVPLDEDQKPKDPVFENMAIINMKPVKAFQYQDHQAHIQVHMAATQDPAIMKMIGQNPQAQAMMAAMMSHIAEHVAFGYRQRIEQQMGIALPPEGEELPPQVELALSGMMAQAAQQVLQENQQQAAQEQAQQQAQDPVVQMQQQELQIKQGELKLKEKKLEVDAAAQADELELKQQALEAKMELDGFKAGRQSQQADKRLEADLERDGVRMGIEIAKSRQGGANRGE
jgi:hypothetical protein